MRLLLDTHALLWWLLGSPRLSVRARDAIGGAREVNVSAVSAFEIATKVRIGKLEEARSIASDFSAIVASQGFGRLAVNEAHALAAARLPAANRDPFDRMLAAQSMIETLTLITRDPAFAQFGVETLW